MKEFDMTHCCELMKEFINDSRLPIDYLPEWRRYYLPLQGSNAIQGILYCPWCGVKLPKNLREEYFDILEKEYNLDTDDDEEKLPKEFLSDEWWKKRGL